MIDSRFNSCFCCMFPIDADAALLAAYSHVRIIWAAAAFRDHPIDVLHRILDVTGFAVDAVLRVDLESRLAPGAIAHDLIDARWTIALFRRVVTRQIDRDGNRGILQDEMDRLILLVIGVGEKHRGQLVERDHAVRLWISDPWTL